MKIPKPPEGDATAKRLHDDCIDAKARLEKTKNTRGRPCTLNDNAWMISCLDTYLGYLAEIKTKTENDKMNKENKFTSRNDMQELKVTEFCAGKTPEQIVDAIRELGETKKEVMSEGFIDIAKTLGVESGDNACYHTANPDWQNFIDLQGQWISFLASREIVDFIEDYKGIGDEKRIDAIKKAIWEAFPSTPKA